MLLLDEPLSGLDPRARIEMRNLMKRLGELGKTIVVSSHILPELADICNKVGIIDRGVISHNAEVAEVMKQVRRQTVLNVAVTSDVDAAAKLLDQHDLVEKIETTNGQLRVVLREGAEDYSELPTILIQAGHKLSKFNEEEVTLVAAFMALTKGMGSKT